MIAANIARALQGKPKPGGGYLCRCPLPDHGKGRGDLHRSLSVDDGEGGRILVRCFAGCGGADVLAELARRDLLPARNGVAPATSTRPRPSPRPVEPHAPSLEIWREAVPATDDTLTARYLRGRRLGGTDRWIGFRSYDTLFLMHFPPPKSTTVICTVIVALSPDLSGSVQSPTREC